MSTLFPSGHAGACPRPLGLSMSPVRIEVRTASRLPDLASVLSRKAESLTEQQQEVVESAAEMLYGLIHARFILTARGMQAMVRREAGCLLKDRGWHGSAGAAALRNRDCPSFELSPVILCRAARKVPAHALRPLPACVLPDAGA